MAILLGSGPAHAQAPETIEYYGSDALGSVRVVFDATGTELARTDYLPFGEEVRADSRLAAQRFTGQERDGEAGFDNFNARMLQSRTGRFGSPDPVFGELFDPQVLNRYSYVRNSPLVLVDPTGLALQCVAHESMKTVSLTTGNDPGAGKRGETYVLVYELNCVNYGDSSPESPGINVPTGPTNTPGGGGGSGGGTPTPPGPGGGGSGAPTGGLDPGGNLGNHRKLAGRLKSGCWAAPVGPDGVSIAANREYAANLSGKYWYAPFLAQVEFVNLVRPGGAWDYKLKAPRNSPGMYEAFGNFHFGVVASAMGVPLNSALRGAGAVQILTGTSQGDFGVPWGGFPYGDDPRDSSEITRGYAACN